MSEFNNRVDAQRRILQTVNSSLRLQEELFGLSSGALERWSRVNGFDSSNSLVRFLHEAAAKLFFLSNKSQEQITNEYSALSADVDRLAAKIKEAIKSELCPSYGQIEFISESTDNRPESKS